MRLVPSTRLGPYEIQDAVGAGGMGEVYRAKDTRLHRLVAIKVLPEHLSNSPKLRERFEREARSISALSHPNVCTLYDVGHEDGLDFLVMEYLEGQTLAERLKKGALPLPDVLRYAIDIAGALAAAHRHGIVHRDLKPANIKLTKTGAKVLDFGLAKIRAGDIAGDSTRTVDTVTEEGVILGTLQYMAPEQLEGKEADGRSDIFAFGAVVHEMATGKKVFEGKSRASIMAAILEREPPSLTTLNPLTPQPLDRAIKRCLAKEPDDRWQSAIDLQDELNWIAENGSSREISPPRPVSSLLRERLAWLAAMAAAALLSGVTVWRVTATRPSPSQVTRFSIAPPPSAPLLFSPPAISADGSRLVFEGGFGDTSRLYLRPLDGFEATPIRGTELGVAPFLSPDGQWVGFLAAGKLKSVRVTGGVPQTICDSSDIRGADWAANGSILFATDNTSLWRVPASGGTPQPATTLDRKKGEIAHLWPQTLPGKDAVLFTIQGPRYTDFHVAVESLSTHQRRHLSLKASRALYAGSGHLVYSRESSLLAVPFDLAKLETTGSEISILENLRAEEGFGQFAVSKNGTLVYGVGPPALKVLVWVDRRGNTKPVLAPPRVYSYPRISPDGKRVATEVTDGSRTDLWIYDLVRDVLTRLTFDGSSRCPTWSADAKRIVFNSTRAAGIYNLFAQAADGSGQAEQLLPAERGHWPSAFSHDGRFLTFVQTENDLDAGDIWVMSLGLDRSVRPLVRMPSTQYQGLISPDGRWLAYLSDETGRFEVYVTSFPSAIGKYQVSTEGGTEAAWAPSGRELFWRNQEKLMAAELETGSKFSAANPKVLFTGYIRGWPGLPQYDVAPDGQHFLMLKGTQAESAPAHLNVVSNWFEELRTL
jgi:eukaryotic-like serine/threonine-protein kinase